MKRAHSADSSKDVNERPARVIAVDQLQPREHDRAFARTRRRYLAAVGDANDPITWSGIPYHFLQTAKAYGLLDEGLPLSVNGAIWRPRRWGWNALRVLSGDRYGGYQYSINFFETLWRPFRESLHDSLVMNCFQLFPPSVVADNSIEKWFFIDQTLQQLFDDYGLRSTVGRRIALEAMKRERDGYHAAAGVIVHSRWAAKSVIEDYGVPEKKVHVVVPGASLDADLYRRWEKEEIGRRKDNRIPSAPLRLVFVGKDWRRKGLDRLLRGLAIAQREGCRVTLRVIGCARESLPEELRTLPGVEWCGFIDKRREGERFLRLVAECDVGCLLSRAEAGGIALREYHALGLAVLIANVGGSPEHAIPEACIIVDGESANGLANVIWRLERNTEQVRNLKVAAWIHRRSVLWSESVKQTLAILNGETLRNEA